MTELDLRHDARIFSALLEASDSSGTTRRQEPTAALAGHKSKGIGPSGDHRGASASRSHSSNGTSSPHTYSGEAYLPLAAQPIPQVVNTIVPVADSSPSLPELIEKHVRRTLLCVGADGTGTDEVRLELSDPVLPGMSLALRRIPGGWQLAVAGDNRESLQRLSRFAPALVKRFAAASLGSLEILAPLELEPT